ncbi:MAG: magnesium transporter [Acidimicrobiia bacterium]|nr:magnesium transporter [Acidimicrobiia bacterium]
MARRRLSSVGRAWRPLGGLLGPAADDATQSLGALALSATTSLITGFTFAAVTETLRTFPGLLLFIPAAIGLRGNVFGPLGSRLSTAIRAGTFSWSWRIDSLLGQNVLGAMATSLAAAVGLAAIAEFVATWLRDGEGSVIGIADFVVVSVFGGTVASIVVLVITLGLAVASARFGWDLDNVTAPLVSASGDFVTLPALVLATYLIQRGTVTRALAVAFVVFALAVVVLLVRSMLRISRQVLLESLPVLVVAGTLSLVAGAVLERSIERLLTFSVLLVLLPGYLSTAGALGGILSSRLSTKVHLGLIEPARIPRGDARADIRVTFALALPIFALLAVLAGTVGSLAGRTSPGLLMLVSVALTGGLVATAFVAGIAYYGTLAVVRFGLDPDNHGIPLVSASLDVIGALTLVGALLLWRVA